MTPEQISEFLEKPRLADLATVRPDGSPQVAPVWYDYDGTVFRVVVEPAAIKIRNGEAERPRRDVHSHPRAALRLRPWSTGPPRSPRKSTGRCCCGCRSATWAKKRESATPGRRTPT